MTTPRTKAQRLGDSAEGLVEVALRRSGWTILARRLRVGRAEVDLLAVDPGPPAWLVVVEVRWRSSREWGLPEETVDPRKRLRLRGALARLRAFGLPGGASLPALHGRLDLVVVEPARGGDDEPRIRHHRYVG